MTIQVRAPDGTIVNFPDGTPRETMRAAMAKRWGGPQQKAEADAAVVTDAIQGKFPGGATLPKPLREFSKDLLSRSRGAGFGWMDEAAGAAYGASTDLANTIAKAFGKPGHGYSGKEAAAALRKGLNRLAEQQRSEKPITTMANEVAGGAWLPVGKMMGAAKGLPAVARSAGIGGATGALMAAGEADPGKRLEAAGKGGFTGAVTGAAVPVAVDAAVKGFTTLGRAANKVAGGKLASADTMVGDRIKEALEADGITLDDLMAAKAEAQRIGAPVPSLVDVARAHPSGGQNTLRLVRAAASTGGGANAATKNLDQVAADLQDAAIARARKLTPDARPAEIAKAEIAQQRGLQANTQYAEPYSTDIEVTPEMLSAIQGPEGLKAIRRAEEGASARRDVEQLQGLKQLRAALEGGAPASPITVKASVADRIQRALGEIGRNADKSLVNRKGDVAAGMFDRQASVNKVLDDVEGLAPARAAFKESIEAEKAIDEGLSILNADPDTFDGLVKNMSPVQRDALKVGVRQAITDAIGKPTEGATGVLNRLGTATNMKRNLAAALGKAEAEAFQSAIKANVDRLNNARFVAPGTGSQTATRLEDMGLIDPEALKPEGIVARLLNKLRAGATLTDQERELLVRMSQSQGGDVEAVLSKLPKPKRDLSKAIQAASGGAVLATQGGY